MASCTAAATVTVGRVLLENGHGDALGHFYALSMGAEVMLNLALGGYQAHYYPAFCAAARQPDAATVLGRLTRTAASFTVPMLALVVVTAPVAVPLLLSERFVPVVPLVGMLAVGVYLRVLGAMFGIPLLARGHLVSVVVLHGAWSLSLVGVFLWVGAESGARGWVTAFTATSALQVVALTIVTHRWLRLRLGWRTVALVVGGALLLGYLAR
jgi:O-antigen/teichoic acid export membrane protein